MEQKAAIHKLRFATATLLASVVLLTIFGLVMLYSTTSATSHQHFLLKQSVWIFLGMVLAAVICVVDYRRIGAASKWVLLLVALPLVYLATAHVLYRCGYDWITELPFVASINGAFRWLRVGNFTLQPSEFAKPALIIFLAHYYGTNPRNVLSFIKGVWRPVLVVGMIVILVLLGGSLVVLRLCQAFAHLQGLGTQYAFEELGPGRGFIFRFIRKSTLRGEQALHRHTL